MSDLPLDYGFAVKKSFTSLIGSSVELPFPLELPVFLGLAREHNLTTATLDGELYRALLTAEQTDGLKNGTLTYTIETDSINGFRRITGIHIHKP